MKVAYSWLEIHKHCARDVVFIIRLIEKHILAVIKGSALGVFLENAFWRNSVLLAQLLPELNTD